MPSTLAAAQVLGIAIMSQMNAAFERPVRDIEARCGTQTNCSGMAQILADIEPAAGFEFIDAHDGAWTGSCEDELVDRCVAAVRRGVLDELTRVGGGKVPAVRFVLRRVWVHPVDSAESRNEAVGRIAITRAVQRLTEPASSTTHLGP